MMVRPKIRVACVGLAKIPMHYRISIILDGVVQDTTETVAAAPGFTGDYDFPAEIHDVVLHDAAMALIEKVGKLAEVNRMYIVASSPAAAHWGWTDNIKGGTKSILSHDLDFVQAEAKYESMRYRERKGESINEPDHYRAYTITTKIEESKDGTDTGE